ncbi:MAG: AAA family ATPase [Acidobacteriota bacterium]|nr:AAA family ATPase [Acidobacteriota bacterium]
MTTPALDRLKGLRGFRECGKNQYEACCPAHEDRKASLSIGVSDSKILLHCHAGCDLEQILAAAGLEKKDLFPSNGNGHHARRIVATYDYCDPAGNLSYQVVRFDPKDFRQRRPDGNGGWIDSVKGLKRLPYNLPELAEADYVWITEGEKDADNLRKIGLTATCIAGGAKSPDWPTVAQYFRAEQHVTIIPDNDEPGEIYARNAAQALFGKVASLKILRLEGLPKKGDVSDWLQGRDPIAAAEELCRLADAAPEWKPESRFRIGSAINALKPQPPIDFVLRDFLARKWLSIWYGEPGCKKTWGVMDQAVCVASGKPWLGFHAVRSTVLIVDEESGEQRLLRRLGDTMRGHGISDDIPLYYVSLHGFNLTNESGADDLEALVAEVNPGLLIIDALADIMLGGDENLVKDTQPVLVRLRRIAERQDCAIEVIHHVNKAGEYRGSTALKGAVDTMIQVESRPDSPLVGFSAEKTRDVIIKPFAASAHFDIGQFHLTEAEPQAGQSKLSPSEKYVLRFLEQNGPSTIATIMDHADTCSGETARRSVYNLASRDIPLVRRCDYGGKGKEATYELVRN